MEGDDHAQADLDERMLRRICNSSEQLDADACDGAMDRFEDDFETELPSAPDQQHWQSLKDDIVAAADALPAEWKPELRRMLDEFGDKFRCGLTADPPVSIPPLSIQLIDGAKAFRCRQRRYAPAHYQFLTDISKQLEEFGCIVKNNAARFASAALAVPNPVVLVNFVSVSI